MEYVEGSHTIRDGHAIPEPTSPRVLVVGDSHGSLGFLARAAATAAALGISTILQCGDFGFWPDKRLLYQRRLELAEPWLDACAEQLAAHGVTLRAIDGNHDFIDGVRARYTPGADGIVPLRDGVLDWASRGSAWTWHGRSFVSLGGAVSVDQDARVPSIDWWPSEAITEAELAATLAHGSCDVLVTHDCPAGVALPGLLEFRGRIAEACATNRAHVAAAAEHLAPELLVHGHYHRRHTAAFGATRVEGLACDDDPFSSAVAVCDLTTLALTPPPT